MFLLIYCVHDEILGRVNFTRFRVELLDGILLISQLQQLHARSALADMSALHQSSLSSLVPKSSITAITRNEQLCCRLSMHYDWNVSLWYERLSKPQGLTFLPIARYEIFRPLVLVSSQSQMTVHILFSIFPILLKTAHWLASSYES